jgi:signal peptidase I
MIAVALLLFILVPLMRQFVVQPLIVPTSSMQPTLMAKQRLPHGRELAGDRLLLEKVSFLFRSPARGDIVVFKTKGIAHPSVPQDQLYIKRVVGIPGDRIRMEAPGVRVNGTLLTVPEIFQKIASRTNGHCGYSAMGTFAVAEDQQLQANEYFVAGDNGGNSLDSRYFGPIQKTQIVGRVWFIYFPLKRIGIPE